MKILILWSGAVVPAYRQFFLELARHMRVRVLSPRSWTHGSRSFEGAKGNTNGNQKADGKRDGNGEPGEGKKTVPDSGCEIIPVTYLPERSSRYWVPSLALHLWRFRPRYLYIMDEMDRPSLAWHALIARLAWPPVRVVQYALQNIAAPGYYRWHHRLATRINQALVSLSIAASREAEAVLKANGFRKPVRVIPLWGSEAFYMPGEPAANQSYRREHGVSEGETLIVFAGSMVEAKGVKLLAEALSRHSRLKVISAGNGPLAATAPRQAPGQWIHLGALEGEELRRLYQAGDYIILPSVTLPDWKEQVGRSLIEGILCGCIALGSDSGHIPEITLFPDASFRQGEAVSLHAMLAGLPLADADAVRKTQLRNVRARFTAAAVAEETAAFVNGGGS
ncbi:MAG: glycosyltransferase [Fibrobacteria bacterium]